jgi:hypothetical protein
MGDNINLDFTKKKKERETEEYDGKKNLRQSRRCKDNIKANFIKI